MFHHLPNQKVKTKIGWNHHQDPTVLFLGGFLLIDQEKHKASLKQCGELLIQQPGSCNEESRFWGALWYPILGTEKKAEARNHPGRKSLLFVSQDLWAGFGGAFGEFQWSSSTTLTGPPNFWVLAELQESSILPTKIFEKYVSNLQNDHHDSWHESSCNGSKNTMSTHPFHSSKAASPPNATCGSEEKNAVTETPNPKPETHSPASWIKTWTFWLRYLESYVENMRRFSTGSDWEGLRLGKYIGLETENRENTPKSSILTGVFHD